MITRIVTPAALLFAAEAKSLLAVPWSWETSIVLPLAALLIVYTAGLYRRGDIRTLRWRHASFYAGWLALALALVSPIHELGEQLFTAHMLQHEILILLSAPLISASHPAATLLWAFAPRHRVHLGGWVHAVEQSGPVRLLTRPMAAWFLSTFALWVWHVPALYQATLTSDWIHATQHLSFLVSAVVFWSALYGVGRSAMSYGAATFYVFATAVQCSALGALLTFSAVLWYPVYQHTTQAWALTPLQDQQLGGVVMWVPSGIVFIVIGLILFAKWLGESDRRLAHTSLQTALNLAKGDQ